MATHPGNPERGAVVREVRASQRTGWIIRAVFLSMAVVPLVAAGTILAADPRARAHATDEEFQALLPPGHPPIGCEGLRAGHPPVDLDDDEGDLPAMLPPGHPPVGASRLPPGHPRVRPAPEGLELFPQDGVTRT
jgi:hypothetical protein